MAGHSSPRQLMLVVVLALAALLAVALAGQGPLTGDTDRTVRRMDVRTPGPPTPPSARRQRSVSAAGVLLARATEDPFRQFSGALAPSLAEQDRL